jgi:hypothetical protein
MEERYNVYFAGQVMEGHESGSVRGKLAKVFNADQATLDKLFSGKAQLIKRNCDKATAQKYKEALEHAGAMPIIQPAEPPVDSAPTRAMTTGERIAALATAPDEDRYRTPGAGAAPARASGDDAAQSGGITLAPPGTEVLREDERAAPVAREVDTAGLAVDTTAQRLSAEPPPAPAPPDTGHLTLGDVGDSIPNLDAAAAPINPNLDGLALSAVGTDFSDCTGPEPQVPQLDLSGLAALPPGSVTEGEEARRPPPVATPSTDHLSLDD